MNQTSDKTFDVVLIERPADGENLSRSEIVELLDMLNNADDIIPLEVEGDNSSAMGFITGPAADTLDFDLQNLKNYIAGILNDMTKENTDNTYDYTEFDDYGESSTLTVFLSRNVPSAAVLKYPNIKVSITLSDNDIDDLGIRDECNSANSEQEAYDIAYDAICSAVADVGRLRRLGLSTQYDIDTERIKALLEKEQNHD